MSRTPIMFFLLSLITVVPAWADINSGLLDAARRGDSAIVKALLAKGADVTAKDKKGETALMHAKRGGHTEILDLLKRAGAKE